MSEQFIQHKTLAAALRSAMEDCPYVQKTVRVETGGGRSYVAPGEADILAAVRPALVRHGVVGPVPLEIMSISVTDCQTKSGGTARHCLLTRRFRVYHADSDQTMDVVTAGEAVDSGLADKATAKALTQSKTYALRELMVVECGNDPAWIASERGSETEPEFRRAATAIESASNAGAVQKVLDAMAKRPEMFDDEQIVKLREAADKKIRSFPGQKRDSQ